MRLTAIGPAATTDNTTQITPGDSDSILLWLRKSVYSSFMQEAFCCITVLVVEDNALLRQIYARQLRMLGVEVHSAANGAEAVDLVYRNRYDLVVMDIQMPVMDGRAASRKIRDLYSAQDLPIIAVTAEASREECFEAGMNDYYQKPFMLEQIREALTKHVPGLRKTI